MFFPFPVKLFAIFNPNITTTCSPKKWPQPLLFLSTGAFYSYDLSLFNLQQRRQLGQHVLHFRLLLQRYLFRLELRGWLRGWAGWQPLSRWYSWDRAQSCNTRHSCLVPEPGIGNQVQFLGLIFWTVVLLPVLRFLPTIPREGGIIDVDILRL